MIVLVTGASGTIGRPLVKELESRGHAVIATDMRHDPFFHGVGNPEPFGQGVVVERMDVREYRQVQEVIRAFRPDFVYHLAAEFGRFNGEYYYEQLWQTNVIGTRHVAEVCHDEGVKLIFASSSEVYGDSYGSVSLEEGLTVSMPPTQKNDYAISKWVNEMQIAHLLERWVEFDAMTLRFFNSYGPGEDYHPFRSVVCLFIHKLLRGQPITVYKGYKRSFMYIDDFIPTLANACENFVRRETVNIGGAEVRSVDELVGVISDLVPVNPDQIIYQNVDALNVVDKIADIQKARDLLGHNPTTTLEDGVKKTVEHVKRMLLQERSS